MSRASGFLLASTLCLSLAASGCHQRSSYVVLTLHSAGALSVSSLEVDLSNAGDTTTVHIDKSFALPPDNSLSLQMGGERRGDVAIALRAYSGSAEIAHAAGTVTLVPAGSAPVTLNLIPSAAGVDMGTADSGPDMSTGMADLSTTDGGALRKVVFSPPTAYAVDSGPTGLAITDLNGDGKSDVLAIGTRNDANMTSYLAYFAGDGAGKLVNPVYFDGGSSGPNAIATSDLNGDGMPDVLTADNASLSVYVNGGGGIVKTRVAYPGTGNYFSLATGLINSDKQVDAIAVTTGCEVDVFRGNGDGTFQAALKDTSYAQSGFCRSVSVGDVNGDGKTDVVVGISAAAVGVGILLGNGDGTFVKGQLLSTGNGSPAGHVSVIDANADGRPDIAASNQDGTIGILIGNGDGTFQARAVYPSGVAGNTDLIAADLNADGHIDVVTADGLSSVAVLTGRGDGTFASGAVSPVGTYPTVLDVHDLNGDGKVDLAIGDIDHHAPSVYVLLNETP